jgi:hypothetical protein
VILICLPLYVICFFSLTAFNILTLVSVLVVLMVICHGVVLFWSGLFGVLKVSYTYMGIVFSRLGKFSVIILLNMLHIPFPAPLLLHPCPWFSGLVFDGLSKFLHFLFTGL